MNQSQQPSVCVARCAFIETFRSLVSASVGGLPRQFWVLFTAALIDRIGAFVVPYLALYLTLSRGLSVATAGLIVSALGVGGLVGTPFGGALSDRVGRKPVLVGGLLSVSAALVHLGFASGPLHIGTAALLLGVAGGIGRPAMAAAIADCVPEADRRRAYGLHYWAINLGFAVAATLAGSLMNVAYSLVFALDAVTCCIAAALLWVLLVEPDRVTSPSLPASPRSVFNLAPFKQPTFVRLFIASACVTTIFGQASVALSTEVARDGMATWYGPLIAVNGALIVLLQPVLNLTLGRASVRRTLMGGSVLVGVGFFLTAACDRWWQYVLAIAVWTVGEILLASAGPAAVIAVAPVQQRGAYQGAFQMAWSIAAFAPALGAWVLDHTNSSLLWGACLVLGLTAATLQWTVRDPRVT